MNPKVDFYFNKANKWQDEIQLLRAIVLESGLTEDLKWGVPCYTLDKKNVVLIHVFKEYCALLFFKGALLKDPKGILVQQTENVQAGRQVRFANVKEIVKLKAVLKTLINEAIKVEKAGLKVPLKKHTDLEFSTEFKEALAKNPKLQKAFDGLTPGRQRAYNLYFTSAKQSQTRTSRVEKSIPDILQGIGLNER